MVENELPLSMIGQKLQVLEHNATISLKSPSKTNDHHQETNNNYNFEDEFKTLKQQQWCLVRLINSDTESSSVTTSITGYVPSNCIKITSCGRSFNTPSKSLDEEGK